MKEDFFHAYVIGGHKDDARDFIESFLNDKKINLEKNPDVLISEHVIFTIDHVRNLREWLKLTPLGEQKIYIVYATFITKEAENALLKTLEEPVAKTHIILATPKPEMLLPTLLSRVQVIIPDSTKNKGVHKVEEFIAMNIGERMEFVKNLVEKGDDEYASAEVREKAVAFFDDLEKYFSKNISKTTKDSARKIESILKLKKYLFSPACSTRNIMETLALTI
jgi:DNA polymerase III delta prime subunit